VLSGEAVFQAFWSDDPARAFLHSHSYTGNPLACAAANAVLDRFDAGQEARCAEQAAWLAQAFAPLLFGALVERWGAQALWVSGGLVASAWLCLLYLRPSLADPAA